MLKSKLVGDEPCGTPEVKKAEEACMECRLRTTCERFERQLCIRVRAEMNSCSILVSEEG